MNPFLTQQLANQRIDDMHQAAKHARLAHEAQTHERRTTPAFTFRRRRTCAA